MHRLMIDVALPRDHQLSYEMETSRDGARAGDLLVQAAKRLHLVGQGSCVRSESDGASLSQGSNDAL